MSLAFPSSHLNERLDGLISQCGEKVRVSGLREFHQRERRLISVGPYWRVHQVNEWLDRNPACWRSHGKCDHREGTHSVVANTFRGVVHPVDQVSDDVLFVGRVSQDL